MYSHEILLGSAWLWCIVKSAHAKSLHLHDAVARSMGESLHF